MLTLTVKKGYEQLKGSWYWRTGYLRGINWTLKSWAFYQLSLSVHYFFLLTIGAQVMLVWVGIDLCLKKQKKRAIKTKLNKNRSLRLMVFPPSVFNKDLIFSYFKVLAWKWEKYALTIPKFRYVLCSVGFYTYLAHSGYELRIYRTCWALRFRQFSKMHAGIWSWILSTDE